jgi:hypothetical protein
MNRPGFFHKSISAVFIIFLVVTGDSFAAGNYSGIGSRSIALADATVSLTGSFAAFYNQAGLAYLKKPSISSFYQQKGMVEGYSDMAGVFCQPVSSGVFAVSFLQTGISGYHESRAGISFAKLLSPNFSVGLQFNYFMIDIPESAASRGVFVFEGGLQYSVKKEVFLGVHIFNPFNAKIETLYKEKKIPLILKCGAGFLLGEDLLLVTEAMFLADRPLFVKGGFEYSPVSNMSLRGGISGRPLNSYFGAGYKWGKFSADLAFSKHRMLGYSPSISLNYIF